MEQIDLWVSEAESRFDDPPRAQDPRLAGLLPPPTPPDRRHIYHWFRAGDAYQLVEGLIRTHEDLVDDMVDYLWNVGDRPARDLFGSLEELAEAYAEASDRNGPRRLLEMLIAVYPVQARVILNQLPELDRELRDTDADVTHIPGAPPPRDYSAETHRLTTIAKRARLVRRCAALCRGPRRRGAGRPGHRSRNRANAPPASDDDPPDPEPHPVARQTRRAVCAWLGVAR